MRISSGSLVIVIKPKAKEKCHHQHVIFKTDIRAAVDNNTFY
jgi:hypothetical protein